MPRRSRFTPDRELFRQLVEQVPAVVFIESNEIEWRTLYMSPQATELLGDPPERWVADARLGLRRVHPDDYDHVMQAWRRSVSTGAPYDVEYRYQHPDGRVLWLHERQRLVTDDGGEPRYWLGLVEDVTDIRSAAEELRISESRYRALVEQLPAVVYIDSDEEDPQSIYVSPNCQEILGHSAASYVADRRKFRETIHPADRDRVFRAWRRAVREAAPFSLEYRFVRPDGRDVWVRDTARLVLGPNGERAYWQGVILDITATKRFEHELAASERRYRSLVEQLPAVIYEMGPDDERRTLFVSPHVEDVLGYSRVEWLDQPDIWIELLHPDDREIQLAAHDLQSTTGEPWQREYRLIAADGRIVWVRDQAVLTVDERGERTWQGVMLDVTARKEAEAKASEAEARYRMLAEHGPAIAYTWEPHSPDSKLTFLGSRIERLLGFPLDRWRSFEWFLSIVHPDDRRTMQEASERIARTGKPWAIDYRVIAADGRVVWMHDEGRLLTRDDAGRPHTFQGILFEVTARMETERQREAVEASARTLLEQMPAVPWTSSLDPETGLERMVYIGPQSVELLGYTPDELLSEPDHFARMVHPDDRERVLALNGEANAARGSWQDEFRVVARDGTVKWLHAVGRLATAPGESPAIWHGVTIDVSAIRAARDRGGDAIEAAQDPGR
jgi:PAS domain S-box-containing protein